MTEKEFLERNFIVFTSEFVKGGVLSHRKARLFAAACVRRIWDLVVDERSRRAVAAAETFADEGSEPIAPGPWPPELKPLRKAARAARVVAREAVEQEPPGVHGYSAAAQTAKAAVFCAHDKRCLQTACCTVAALVATAVGPPNPNDSYWRTLVLHPASRLTEETEWAAQCDLIRDVLGPLPFRAVALDLAWLTPTVASLAQAIYEERSLPSGHLDTSRLAMLADALEEAGCDNADILAHLRSPGPHVRGCWPLDLLLGKS